MSGYRHGVYIQERPTSVFPPVRITVSMPVVFGTAPVHKQAAGRPVPVNEPVLCYSYQEFVENFNFDDEFAKHTLCEFAKVYFALYAVAPAVIINVFDPGVHKTAVAAQAKTFDSDDMIVLGRYGITGLVVESEDGQTTYTEGTHYTINPSAGTIVRIPVEGAGGIAAGATVLLDYTYADPSLVTADDIVGGIVADTGQKTGLELVNEVFPRFRLLPGNLAAPGWSQIPEVAITMAAKAGMVNGLFKAMAVVDLPVFGAGAVDVYSKAPGWKNDYNYMDELMIVCWPKLKLGNDEYWMSSHVCGLMSRVDWAHEELPYKSPSNERFLIEGATLDIDGETVWLGHAEANYLNGQGIVTALNFIGGWRCWGNRTGCYPANTDVKDAFIPIRRMFNWIGNTLVLSAWQKVDFPITRRLVETIVDSFNIWLNGLAAREVILGGRVEFHRDDNPTTDVMDGILRFRVYVTPPSPARELVFIMEYDPAYIATLFG